MDLRKNWSVRAAALLALVCTLCLSPVRAQNYSEDFTGTTTNNAWYFSGGACLTAGNSTSTTSQPGNVVGCATALLNYYSQAQDRDPSLVGGFNGNFPDPVGKGALRFTNGAPYGHFETGSIVSGFPPFPTSQGITISFKTVAYKGTADGQGGDGADGISFFLMDGCVPLAGTTVPANCANSGINYGSNTYMPIGATGGSLGYSCNNHNPTSDGLPGAYLGLGVDEFGNFLNGVNNTLNDSAGVFSGDYPDNTLTGGLYHPGRIGLRGAGNINWQMLNNLYGNDPNDSSQPYYPSSLSASQRLQAIQNTCRNGKFYNYKDPQEPRPAGNTDLNNPNNTAKILDYAAISNGWTTMPAGNPIAAENAATRGQAKPIVYNLNITQDGKLSFALSYNGGAFQNILSNTDIKSTNGTLPSSFRFGFAGSTGGSTNIHEILCFKATPNQEATGSGAVNVPQNPEISLGTQLFLASYFPTKAWAGTVTAQTLGFDTGTNTVVVKTTPNWDASCKLTGVGAGQTCSTGATNVPPLNPNSRVLLTWNNNAKSGAAFEWKGLNSNQQSAIDPEGLTNGVATRLNFLRGDRSNEIPLNAQLFRTRTSVLGDIINSSPTWVGPPSTYPSSIQWVDMLQPTQQQPEGSGPTYASFQSTMQSRLNVVYVGANDGFLHGFRAGSFDSNNAFVDSTTTPNDGQEVIGYMPGAVSLTIHNTSNAALDYSNTQYGHAYFVDATPGTGDVFYGSQWHTWVVGGMGAGGPGFYALDVTDPSKFSEANTKTVIADWTPTSIGAACGSQPTCGDQLGNVSGIPQIRRFHNGQWGFIFGNGVNSASGDAGIFVALLDKNTGTPALLYFSATNATRAAPNTPANGIVAVSAADLDGDHIVDYVYAGDIRGNVWKFDLTEPTSAQWGSITKLFTEPNGNPITTQVTVSTLRTINTQLGLRTPTVRGLPERIILNFATGRMIPQSQVAATQYAQGTQFVYGIWDADQAHWNSISPGQPTVQLPQGQTFQTITSTSVLQPQTITTQTGNGTITAIRSISKNPICFADTAGCKQMGWFMQLPTTGEQVIFDPIISPDGTLVLNTFVPPGDSPLSCSSGLSTGFTMAMEPDSGTGTPTPFFFINSNLNADGVQLNGTGIPSLIQSGQSADANAQYLLTQTSAGTSSTPVKTNRHVVVTGLRLNWIERR
jgi:type IV pilus assembly protein PilY1